MSLSGRNTERLLESGWQFGFKLKTEHIWDAFVVLALLRDCEAGGRLLKLPHKGDQKDRFTAAMEERNLRIIQEGQNELRHRCKKCTRVYEWHEDDGTLRHSKCSPCLCLSVSSLTESILLLKGTVQPVMTDGLYSLGHTRCSVPSCREPLGLNRHRFCPVHFENHYVCAVQRCSEPVQPPGKMCANQQHRQMEKLNKVRAEAPFQLASRMQRNRLLHLANSMPDQEDSDSDTTLVNELEEDVTWFDVIGEDPEDVQMCHKYKEGCIGEEDASDLEDIEMHGELAA